MAKHVIILGAGASCTSGYPMAAKLRSILVSAKIFESYINKELGALNPSAELKKKLLTAFASYERNGAGQLFQEGNYNSVDEFCFVLAKNDRLRALIDNLKWHIALAFAIHRPAVWHAKQIANSKCPDYFPFVQKLFTKKIYEMRDDIAVLTYNYDPFLEFVLCSEFVARNKAAGREHNQIPAPLTSGFGDGNAASLTKAKGFCLLKLHGTSVFPSLDAIKGGIANARLYSIFTFANIFSNRETGLLRALEQFNPTYHRPPTIYFPWELATVNGNLRRKIQESEMGGHRQRIGKSQSKTPDNVLFSAIWRRAQKEVATAEKISFIGFGASDIMLQGLQFLFRMRVQKLTAGENLPLKVVTANKVQAENSDKDSEAHKARSKKLQEAHKSKLKKLLNRACPILDFGDIVYCEDFADFIESEM